MSRFFMVQCVHQILLIASKWHTAYK